MTFANLSQTTAASQRFYHRTQNTFNRIQNLFMTIEIHDQGQSLLIHSLFDRVFAKDSLGHAYPEFFAQ